MVTHTTVNKQLRDINTKVGLSRRAAVRELSNVLYADETILHCVFGAYQGGRAVIVATNKRLIILDKKLLFLNLEDIRYHAVTDIQFSNGILRSSLTITSGIVKTEIRSVSIAKLRALCGYVQEQVFAARGDSARIDSAEYRLVTRAKASRLSGRVLLRKAATHTVV